MKKHFETKAIRTQMDRSAFAEHSSPLYLTSSFVFDDAEELRAAFADEIDRNIYSRFSNPNTQELVDKMCALEGAEDGVAFASGMAAVYTSIGSLLSSGDHIVSVRSVFGSTHALFKKYFPKWCIEQSKELKKHGVPFLHYYSMGKSKNVKKIAQALF